MIKIKPFEIHLGLHKQRSYELVSCAGFFGTIKDYSPAAPLYSFVPKGE